MGVSGQVWFRAALARRRWRHLVAASKHLACPQRPGRLDRHAPGSILIRVAKKREREETSRSLFFLLGAQLSSGSLYLLYRLFRRARRCLLLLPFQLRPTSPLRGSHTVTYRCGNSSFASLHPSFS